MYKIIIGVCLILTLNQVQARFSRFVHVHADIDEKFNVLMTPVKGHKNKLSIKFNSKELRSMAVWLIVASSTLSPREQRLRNYIWGKSEPSQEILIKAQLTPSNSKIFQTKSNTKQFYEIEIDSKFIYQSYIYIDHPLPVHDGGFYYSIDLATYFNKINNIGSLKFNTSNYEIAKCNNTRFELKDTVAVAPKWPKTKNMPRIGDIIAKGTVKVNSEGVVVSHTVEVLEHHRGIYHWPVREAMTKWKFSKEPKKERCFNVALKYASLS